MLLTEQYQDKIRGVLSCYDRVVLRGTLPGWSYAQGMTGFLSANHIRVFDYSQFTQPLRDEIRENAQRTAAENGLEIEHIRKLKAFRKEHRIQEVLNRRGDHPGLVHIFSAMETCHSYKPWHNKSTGKTSLKDDTGKCLHYYFYFIDPELGLCYVRVPTWCPFQFQFYFNAHKWLASKLDKHSIPYVLEGNAFIEIGDFEKAQALSDKIRVEDLHQVLDILAERYCPFLKRYGLSYHWTIMQAEYATDIIFKRQSDLKSLYESLVRCAVHSVKPEDIASFLGEKLHWNYQGEMGNNFNTRIEGTRIRHQMASAAIKMYDKFGIILRLETTANNVSQFKHYREVDHQDGTKSVKNAPMKKSIYSLFPLASLLKAANRRYLEFISNFSDPTQGIKKLNTVSKPVTSNGRTYKGFNFFHDDDNKLLTILARGEFNITGFRNSSLGQFFPDKSPSAISRILKRLRLHRLVKRIPHTYKYYVTKLGKAIIASGLTLKELVLIPDLAHSNSLAY